MCDTWGNTPIDECANTTVILLLSLKDKSDYYSLPRNHPFCFSVKNKVLHLPIFPLLIWVAGFILSNVLLAIKKDYTIGHFKTAMDFPPSSFCHLHISGGRKDLHSLLKEGKNEAHGNWASRSHLVSDQAGPGAQASQLWLPQWQSLSLTLLGPSLADQALLSSYCVSAGGWQCCWLPSGSVWALFFHPLIKSCTFLIGEQIFKRGKGTLPSRAFRD